MPSRVRRRVGALVFVALLGLVLAHVAFAGDPAGLSPRGQDSPQAAKIEDIYGELIAITGAIFVLVEGALILFIFRFRNRGRSRTLERPEIHGATRLELIWTAIQVERMRVPVNRDVKLVINSEDVDHSWWIPALQGKFDAIPGKTNHLWFRADRAGTFKGQCGEFCGYEHAHMFASVQAVPNDQFQSWYDTEAAAQANGTSDLGKMTFDGACATCHGFQAQGTFGPDLRGNPILQQPAAMKTLLENGRNKMPAVGRAWSDRQLNALLAYVKRFAGSS